MSFLGDAQTIVTRFATEFATAQPSVTIADDNVDFQPTIGSPFVRISVSPSQSAHAGLGGHYRDFGTAFVQVFTEAGRGAGQAFDIADDVVTIFRGIRVGSLVFGDVRVARIGVDDGGWYQLNVSVPFYSDTFI